MADHLHEHTNYCASVNIVPLRKHTPEANCHTCKAWYAGYRAAFAHAFVEESDDDE